MSMPLDMCCIVNQFFWYKKSCNYKFKRFFETKLKLKFGGKYLKHFWYRFLPFYMVGSIGGIHIWGKYMGGLASRSFGCKLIYILHIWSVQYILRPFLRLIFPNEFLLFPSIICSFKFTQFLTLSYSKHSINCWQIFFWPSFMPSAWDKYLCSM